jgi:hypothetical protein
MTRSLGRIAVVRASAELTSAFRGSERYHRQLFRTQSFVLRPKQPAGDDRRRQAARVS